MAQESPIARDLPRGVVLFPGVRAPETSNAVLRPIERVRTAGDDGSWDDLRDHLVDRWPVLTAAELEATHGKPELVAALIEAKLRYGRRLADEALHPRRSDVARSRRSGTRPLLGIVSLISVSGLAFFGLLHP